MKIRRVPCSLCHEIIPDVITEMIARGALSPSNWGDPQKLIRGKPHLHLAMIHVDAQNK